MARRPGVIVTVQLPADPGKSPNWYLGRITVDIRVFAPPRTPTDDILAALGDAAQQARVRVAREL